MEPLLVKRTSCPLCKASVPVAGARFSIRQPDQSVRVVECPACGLVYKETQPTSRCLDRIYKGNYAHHACSSEGDDWGAAEYVRRMRLPKGSRHLDYGCGNGHVVLQARRAGIESYGADPFLPDFLKQGGSGPFFQKEAAGGEGFRTSGPFDAISLWAVIEHLEQPLETFQGLTRVLKPGGRLFFNAPNADCWTARKDGGHWAAALLVEHSTFWTRRAIAYLSSMSGLDVRSIRRCGIPYPLNRRAADWSSFGVASERLSEGGEDRCGLQAGAEGSSGLGRFARQIVAAGRKIVKVKCAGKVIRLALHLTGLGDHYDVVLEKAEASRVAR